MIRRLPQVAAFVAAGAVVLLVALYAFRPGSPGSGESARAATRTPTPYPSIIPYPTSTPAPTPDTRPLVVDVKTGAVEPINTIPPDYFVRAMLSNGRLLLWDGPGPELVIGVDVPRTLVLPAPDGIVPALTVDRRYVVWLANNHLQVYDATTGVFGPGPVPSGAWLADQIEPMRLADGRLLMPANTTGNMAPTAPVGSFIVDATGAVTDTLPYSPQADSVSPDGLRFAAAQPDGLHVLTIAAGAGRLYRDVQFVVGELAWSPDGTEIAYEVYDSAHNSAGLWIVELSTGALRQIYAPPDAQNIGTFTFVGAHEIELRMLPPELDRYGFLPGVRYRVRDDGSGFHAVDAQADGWEACGPKCGLPPAGYEDAGGIAQWVDTGGGVAQLHWAYVDRVHGTARDVYAGPQFAEAVRSPDAGSVVLLLPRGGGWMLSVIDLASGDSRVVAGLQAGRGPLMQWSPDSKSVLVYYGFGN